MTTEEKWEYVCNHKTTDIVNESYNCSFNDWFPRVCDIASKVNDVTHWHATNCHYIVYNGSILDAYDYHGYNIARDMQDLTKRDEFVDKLYNQIKELQELIGKIK